MTASEYEALQEALRKKLKGKIQLSRYESGFHDGILCAMSVLHGMRQSQLLQRIDREDQKKSIKKKG